MESIQRTEVGPIYRSEHTMIPMTPDYWNRALKLTEKMQIFLDDIPPVGSIFDLKSGARATLADRSRSMVIVEVEKHRSDWIEWSEVKARIAAK